MRADALLAKGLMWGVIALSAITPFVVINEFFFPFITGKNFFFRVVVEILFGGWVILALRKPEYRPIFSWLPIIFGIFVVVIGVADFFGENPFKSFWSNFERMEGWLTLLHLLLYFMVAGSVLVGERAWRLFWNVSVGASVLLSFHGLFQLLGVAEIHQGATRVDASLGNATYLAVYILIHFFITAWLLLTHKKGVWLTWVYSGVLVLQTFILFATATRGAILGWVGGVMLTMLLLALFERERPRWRVAAAGVLVLFLLLVSGFFLIKNTPFVQSVGPLARLSTISLEEGSTRFTIWSMAWEGVKERPLLGWGQENFNYVFNKYYKAELYNQEPWFDRVHNIVFDWLIAGGFLGALAYFFIPLCALFYIWRPRSRVHFSRTEQALLTGLLAGYFFHNLFVFDNITSYILYVSVLAMVYARTSPPIADYPRWGVAFESRAITRVATPLVLIVLGLSLYGLNGRATAASETLIDAITDLQRGNYSEAFAAFGDAASRSVVGGQEVMEQMVIAAGRVAADQNASLATKQRTFDMTGRVLEGELTRAPSDARIHLFASAFYRSFGQAERALEHARRASELSPQKQQLLVNWAGLEVEVGSPEKGITLFNEARTLAPENEDVLFSFASALILLGASEQADELLLSLPKGARYTNDQVLNAYVRAERFEEVRAIWEYRVEQNPENLQARLSFAGTFVALGKQDEAIAQIRRVIELNPSFAQEGEEIIKAIEAGQSVFD